MFVDICIQITRKIQLTKITCLRITGLACLPICLPSLPAGCRVVQQPYERDRLRNFILYRYGVVVTPLYAVFECLGSATRLQERSSPQRRLDVVLIFRQTEDASPFLFNAHRLYLQSCRLFCLDFNLVYLTCHIKVGDLWQKYKN